MNDVPCTSKPVTVCDDCTLKSRLMCRYEARDTAHFFIIILPFFVTTIAGIIRAGLGLWLVGWLVYSLFFFFILEARVLCSHCPYWAEEVRLLRCHANYGVIKLWKYRPGPMSRPEQILFLAGGLIFTAIPLMVLVVGNELLLAAIGFVSAASFVYLLRRNICTRCVHFSCPLNDVQVPIRREFFQRNPMIAEAWEEQSPE